jgi:hypothetical protein
MHCERVGICAWIFLGLVIVTPMQAAVSDPVVLNFEDVFGPCPDDSNFQGPADFTIQDVFFDTPDVLCFNNGRNHPYNTPFQSDWMGFFTYGPGARLTFPQAITSLSFETALVGPEQTPGTFRLEVNGQALVQFTPVATQTPPIQVSFVDPTTSVTFTFVDGASSFMGIDTLVYTPVPEPFLAAWLIICCLLARRRVVAISEIKTDQSAPPDS